MQTFVANKRLSSEGRAQVAVLATSGRGRLVPVLVGRQAAECYRLAVVYGGLVGAAR